jgi:hypothetical protein
MKQEMTHFLQPREARRLSIRPPLVMTSRERVTGRVHFGGKELLLSGCRTVVHPAKSDRLRAPLTPPRREGASISAVGQLGMFFEKGSPALVIVANRLDSLLAV